MIRRLDPIVADFPLSGEHWRDASEEERQRAESAHPRAFARAHDRPELDWRQHMSAPIIEHVKRYCLKDGRIEPLSAILDLDAVRTFLDKEAMKHSKRRTVFGLYAACALVSGDWLVTPFPSAPVEIRV